MFGSELLGTVTETLALTGASVQQLGEHALSLGFGLRMYGHISMKAQQGRTGQAPRVRVAHPGEVGKLANCFGFDDVPIWGQPFVVTHICVLKVCTVPDGLGKSCPERPGQGRWKYFHRLKKQAASDLSISGGSCCLRRGFRRLTESRVSACQVL